ncbi:hypothetical protein SS50377_24038 [Spironucleus salmonicida]|uniref:Myb-like domain-containing protein n=1 Tax=Spironucleus salmonicida TaxID=348837 RepID=V6M1K0_9EUKA|nr:hypothetical protein SS50377_24038 [Spironucleus salmonicida]|eukprot:EST47069.1 hypothetical protein SS50377_12880 [Spironucleus salmonicida]
MKLYWTFEREEQLALAVQRYGKKWRLILQKQFPDSTVSILKNKWTKMVQDGFGELYEQTSEKQFIISADNDDLLLSGIIALLNQK